MKKLETTKSINKPQPIQDLGNNTYYYNYNITPCEIKTYDELSKKEIIEKGWQYTPVYIKGMPSYKECVKQIIRMFLTQDEEFDLINTYNRRVITGVKGNDIEYLEYLQLLDSIKKEVKISFNK